MNDYFKRRNILNSIRPQLMLGSAENSSVKFHISLEHLLIPDLIGTSKI
jgi:hypothetical protein